MTALRSLFLILTLVVLAPQARAETFTSEGPRTLVRSTVARKATAERCRVVLDKALAVCERDLPWKVPAGSRLVVNLFAGFEEFKEAVTKARAGDLVAAQAVTANSNGESYLVCQPRSEPAYLELVQDLPEMTAFLVCHEAVHQLVRRARVKGCELWPDWYAEGMADVIAETCLRELGPDVPFFPFVDDKDHRALEALAAGSWLAAERLVDADFTKLPDRDNAYAQTAALYRYLATDAPRLRKLHLRTAEISGVYEKDAFAKTLSGTLTEVYGSLDKLEAPWREHVKKRTPGWFEVGRSSQFVRDEIVCAAFPGDQSARLVATARPASKTLTLRCELSILGVGSRQAEIFLGYTGRSKQKFLNVDLGGDGFVRLFPFDGDWKNDKSVRVNVPKDVFPSGAWIPVKIQVGEGRLRVSVQNLVRLDTAVPAGWDASEGGLGLGTYKDVVRFRKLESE